MSRRCMGLGSALRWQVLPGKIMLRHTAGPHSGLQLTAKLEGRSL